MPSTVQLKNGTNLQLESKSFASGGEGDLYKIVSPSSFQNQVVKIYKTEKRTKDREDKIQYLASNPPNIEIHDGHHSVIWVNQVVYDNDKFCGFTMPIAKGEKLELLCHSFLPKTLSSEWKIFDLANTKSIELRLKLCFNIAVALYHIHKLNNYVLVDMKPENIMVQSNGLISLIDIDSVAVINQNKVLFPAPVVTPEYAPPEYYNGLNSFNNGMNETWDRFSMAIIFYRLLCGIHPFAGSCISPYEKCSGLSDMIQHGLFPHGLKSIYFKSIPPPHQYFNKLELVIKDLFNRCFIEGHSNPNNRPNADEWCRNLSPQQIIQINRQLPSKNVTYPIYNYSTGLLFNPNSQFNQPLIQYLNPSHKKGLNTFFSGLFGKTIQQKITEQIRDKENEVKLKEKKYEVFKTELQNIKLTFSARQSDILYNEKTKIENLKNNVIIDISYYDKSAKDLFIQEANEIKTVTTLFTESNKILEQKIKQTYFSILGQKFENYENQKNVLQKNLQDLITQEQTEINNLINNPNKLANYKIADAEIKNFGSSTKTALINVGIVTASDFTNIYADGGILNRFGKYVKANGVGWNRAYDLREWQRKLDAHENQLITQHMKQKFQSQIAHTQNLIQIQDANFQKDILPYQTQYNKEKFIFDESIAKLKNSYKEKLNSITEKYNKLHLDISENAKKYVTTIPNRIKEIATETAKTIKNNYDNHILMASTKLEEINKYSDELNTEIINLKNLQNRFRK